MAADDPVDPFGTGSLFDEFDRERRETAAYLLGNDEITNSDNEKTESGAAKGRHTFFISSSSGGESDSENENGRQKSKNRTKTTRGPHGSDPTAMDDDDTDDDVPQNGTPNNDGDIFEMKERIFDLEKIDILFFRQFRLFKMFLLLRAKSLRARG
jgi:hypothetical protein